MSKLQDKIQQVLNERAKNSAKILSHFKNAHALIENIGILKRQIQNAQIDGCSSQVNELETIKTNLEMALGKYAFLENRIQRTDAVYIGLAGESRAGKSTFLQALTGLPEDLIPSAKVGNVDPTTAVHSEIHNSERKEAIIYFFTVSEFEQKLKELLSQFGYDSYYELDRFETLNLSKIGDSKNAKKLKKIQEALPSFRRLLINPEPIVLKEEQFSQGKYYFTYMDDDADHRFYPAVKEAKIYAPFSGVANDVKVVLWDLPGFSESAKVTKTTIEKLKIVDFALYIENTSSGFSHLQEAFDDCYKNLRENILLKDTFKDYMSYLLNKYNEEGVDAVCDKMRTDLRKNAAHEVYECPLKIEGQLNYADVETIFGNVADGLGNTLAKMDDELNAFFQRDFNIEGLSKLIAEITTKIGNTPDNQNVYDFEMIRNISDAHIKSSKDRIVKDLKGLSSEISDTMFPRDENQQPLRGPLTKKLITILKYWMWTDYKEKLKTEDSNEDNDKNEEALSDFTKFQIKNYEITPDILTNAKKFMKDLSGYSPNLQAIENYLRTEWNRKIKKDFDSIVIDLAGNEHSIYSEQIKDIFIKGLEISENENKNELADCITEYLASVNKLEYKGYFKSLVDRFCDDVIGILIRKPFTDERVMFFDEKKNNFYTLACVDDGIDSTVSIEKQPLYPLILRHEDKYIRESKWKDVLRLIGNEIGTLTKEAAVVLIKRFIPIGNIDKVTDIVKTSLKNWRKDRDTLATFLERFDSRSSNDDSDTKEPEYIYPSPKIEQDIQQQLNADIKILNYVLIHSVVNAIDLETPFAAYENNFIEEIVNELNEKLSFNQFVNKHFSKIKPGSDDEIREKMEKMKRVTATLAQIEKLLTNIKSNQ